MLPTIERLACDLRRGDHLIEDAFQFAHVELGASGDHFGDVARQHDAALTRPVVRIAMRVSKLGG